ncbi:hypothetical protein DMENIID0001_160520 [Sergentomyia squamirostris]
MIFLGFFCLYCIRVCLSVAIIAMTEKFNTTLEDGTVIEEQHFDWDSRQQGLILSSFFYGYVFTQILGGVLASKFGGYLVFLCGVAGSSLMALLAPVAASTNIYLLMTVRIIEGLFEGVIFPAMHALLSRWAPVYERSRMTSFAIIGCYTGTIIVFPLSSFLATWTWQSIFYVFGGIGGCWCIFWAIFIRSSPEDDRFISAEERSYIVESLKLETNPKIIHPWGDIFKSTAVWATVISHFASNYAFDTMLTQIPTFLKDTLGFEMEATGLVSALPYLTLSLLLAVGGYAADWTQIKGYLTTRQVRRYFNCGAFLLQSAFILLAAFLVNRIGVIICLTASIGLGAFANIGFMINPLDLAPNHASVIFGISNTIATVPGIISPLLVGVLVTDRSKEQWQIVFFIIVAVYAVGGLFYWFFARGELQPWAVPVDTNPTVDQDSEKKNQDNQAFSIE